MHNFERKNWAAEEDGCINLSELCMEVLEKEVCRAEVCRTAEKKCIAERWIHISREAKRLNLEESPPHPPEDHRSLTLAPPEPCEPSRGASAVTGCQFGCQTTLQRAAIAAKTGIE
jgi:hypothetical protein